MKSRLASLLRVGVLWMLILVGGSGSRSGCYAFLPTQNYCATSRLRRTNELYALHRGEKNDSQVQRTILSLVLGTLALVSPSIVAPSINAAWALTEAQLLVDDVWREVTRQFVDPTFHGQGEEKWRALRLKTVQQVASVSPDEPAPVYEAIRTMLATLGDPYTRFLTPEQYAALASYARGDNNENSGGIGVSLLADPRSGKAVVVNTVPDGPAEKAGIMPGDLIDSVDGETLSQVTAEVVAAKCRGEIGSTVQVSVVRPPEKASRAVTLTRASVQSNPLQISTFRSTSSSSIVGLITLKNFNQQTVRQLVEALEQKPLAASQILVLDLRANAGGYMPAGVDVAKLFLQPQARVISEVDRTGRSTICINDGVGSDAKRPLYILVDERTASASEILAAALQDNHRATIVADNTVQHTFGKGRIQNVQELFDGSGIAVTKAKYVTPLGKDIQGVGVIPDKHSATCGRQDSANICLQDIL